MKKVWTQPSGGNEVSEIHKQLGVSSVVTDILAKRNIKNIKQVVDFLRPSLLNLSSPFRFVDMSKVVGRLQKARKNQEKVLIYGDYDVDGVTSTALLYKVLTDLGFQAVAYIPDRMEEGYGLHNEALLKAYHSGVKLVITVDCGITAVEEVEYAKSLGMDIILTDHHEPQEILPKAYAILNPKVKESGYPFRELAGVGVAFRLAQALIETINIETQKPYSIIQVLDLVALGTIADLVPLIGENRVMVSLGLKQMEETIHQGLCSLLEECGLGNKTLKAGQIAFIVAPRINAAGRMDNAKLGLELLLTGREERAREMARLLSQENIQRKNIENQILEEAIEKLEKDPIPRVIVLSAPGWHHGVIGIVASRLVERYYRPVFLIAEEGEEARGSARGISGYHVLNELLNYSGLLEKVGGHSQAAGFSIKKENIALLREGLNNSATKLPESVFYERVRIDKRITLDDIDATLMNELENLAPFGFGNPNPVFAGIDLPLQQVDTVGQDRSHLKCRFGKNGQWEGIAFRKGDNIRNLQGQTTVDVAFGLEWNNYKGSERIQLMIKEIEPKAAWLEPDDRTLTKEGQIQEEINKPCGEVVVTCDEHFQSIDWRSLTQKEWLEITKAEQYNPLIWDYTGVQLEVVENSLENYNIGIVLGVPNQWQDIKVILESLSIQGIKVIAFAQSLVEDSILKERAAYLSRENLVQIYRMLYDLAKRKNPFHIDLNSSSYCQQKNEIIQALKIFEELRLVRNLGGSNQILIEWIPAKKKLDLESSLRFLSSKHQWEEMVQFRKEYQENMWEQFKIKAF